MEDHWDNGNVIEIIGGDIPIDDQLNSGHELIYGGLQPSKYGNEPPIMETSYVPQGAMNQSMESGQMFFSSQSFGSSNFNVENHRSYKDRHCKNYGDQSGFLHDEQSRIRERNAIILSHGSSKGSSIGYGGGGANGNGGQPPANVNLKPMNWRTKICNKWELSGYCPFGSRCTFAHGVAELQRFGGGPLVSEANPNNQGLMNPNMVAPSGSSVAQAGGSGSTGRPWKGPHKINRIYGDWIDDLE